MYNFKVPCLTVKYPSVIFSNVFMRTDTNHETNLILPPFFLPLNSKDQSNLIKLKRQNGFSMSLRRKPCAASVPAIAALPAALAPTG